MIFIIFTHFFLSEIVQFRPVVGKLRTSDLKNLHLKRSDEENNNVEVGGEDEYIFSDLTRSNGGYIIGNDLQPLDYLKFNARTPFDREVIYNSTLQEHVFDYIFYKLGLMNSTGGVPHPILMTECICNPNYARSRINELLFEKYEIPSLCYGIDALFSYYHFVNNKGSALEDKSGLIIRSGFHATHVLPIFDAGKDSNQFKFDRERVKRLNIGGFHTTDYILKIMQLKYPFASSAAITANQSELSLNVNSHLSGGITVFRAQELKERHCYVSKCYSEELHRLATDEKYFNQQTRIIFDNDQDMKAQIDYYNTHKSELEQRGVNVDDASDQTGVTEKARQFESKQQAEKWLRQMHVKLINTIAQLRKVTDALIVEEDQPAVDIKSKRTAATKQRKKAKLAAQIHEGDDETFGMEDDHWDLYSEMEITERKLDPNQRKELIKEKSALENEIASINREIQLVEQDIYGQQRSIVPTFFMNQYVHPQTQKKRKVAQDNIFYNALYLTVERIRVPEIVFQPSMIGLETAGLIEIIQMVTSQYSKEQQQQLLRNIYLCGGNSRFEQFAERIQAEIRAITPCEWSPANVYGEESTSDAWRGAREWYNNMTSEETESAFLTRKMYDEYGSNRLQQHFMSNLFIEKQIVNDEIEEEGEEEL